MWPLAQAQLLFPEYPKPAVCCFCIISGAKGQGVVGYADPIPARYCFLTQNM